ncbi:sensor histidine kinase [Pseudoalteromonas sp. T1lg65]|uniref:sensor histidine kinase n=1 Tax=Pseudoalteromonas sp. T1lg65 TaxID=2077101 RepID=UPI003F7A8141
MVKVLLAGLSVLCSLPCWSNTFPEFSDTAQVMHWYDYNSGLSQVTVTSIAQDQLGYIWVGTQAGLNRFDGHEFINFQVEQSNEDRLAGAFITSLCHSGKLVWIGTRTGLSVYDTELGTFQSILAGQYEAVSSDRVLGTECYGDSVTVSTEEGEAYRVDANTLTPQKLYLTGKFIREARETQSAFLYLSDKGLISQPKDKVGAEVLLEGAFKEMAHSGQRIYLVDEEENLVGYDTQFGKIIWKKRISDKINFALYQVSVRANEILVSSNNGVFILDLQGEIKHHWYKRAEQDNGLRDNNVMSVLRDQNGDLWIGTETQGLHFFSQLSESFGHVSEHNYPHSPIGHADIRSFELDESDRLWIGTSSGAYIFANGGFVAAQRIFPQLSILKGAFITQVRIYDNVLWVTTRGEGVIRYGLIDGELFHLKPNSDNGPELSFNDIYRYQGDILFSSRTLGVMRFDTTTKTLVPFFEHHEHAPNHVSSMRKVGQDLWFGTIGEGLFKYSQGQLYNISTADGLESNLVFMLDEDPMQRIWAASETGVTLIDKNFKVVETITEADGLSNEAIWGLIFDGHNHMWLGTSGGLSRVNVNDLDIDNFLPVDGVQAHEFNYNAAWRAPDGRVFMGGAKGFNQFFPQNVAISNSVRPLLVSSIELLGEPLSPSKNGLLSVAPELAESISLKYDQNIISLQYSSLDYGSADLRFYYRVVGLSDKWLKLASGVRQINLLQLEPGDYTVQTYTINRFNLHSPIHEFNIHISAPIWWNNLSKTIYLLIIIIIFALVIRARQQRYQQVVADNRKMSELQERLEFSLWASGDELWDWHVQSGRIFRFAVNPRIDYGTANEFLSSDELNQFVHPDDVKQLESKLEACLSGEVDTYEVAVRVKTSQGDWTWALDRGKVVVRDHHGKAERIAGALKDIADLKAHQQALQRLNEQLEIKVAMRTDELYKKNQKLEQAMIELKRAQDDLIESEKMASLGAVVAGVAHEINTPLGVAITALSYNEDSLNRIKTQFESKALTQSELAAAIQTQLEGYGLINRNLSRAESLISNFKQVAVDQSSESQREINLLSYLFDVFESLKPLSKGKNIDLHIGGDKQVVISTFPGAIYQILTNLFSNSLIHGFEQNDKGQVNVLVSQHSNSWKITYTDDGKGMDENLQKTMFEPFVTTKRNQGGCGLGMHIVYNLVTQLLKGEIRCKTSEGEGIEITITVPTE